MILQTQHSGRVPWFAASCAATTFVRTGPNSETANSHIRGVPWLRPTAPRTTAPLAPRRVRAGGFSLAEVLIATAIMGVGLVMVLGLFPAAIELNRDSVQDVLGTMICENGISLVKARLTFTQNGLPFMSALPVTLTDLNSSTYLGPGARTYPANEAGCTRGFLVLGRRVSTSAARNDFQFVIVAFAKTQPDANYDVRAVPLTCTINANNTAFTVTGQDCTWLTGSPVIDPATGSFGRVQYATFSGGNTSVVLDHPIGAPLSPANPPYVIQEFYQNSATPVCPAMCTMVYRTGLRPQ